MSYWSAQVLGAESREPDGRLPSDEVGYDTDIPFSHEEHSPTSIMESQSRIDFHNSSGWVWEGECILNKIDQLLAVYRTESVLYMNDILLIKITNSLFVIYIYIYILIFVFV